jgi:hypothetical protein
VAILWDTWWFKRKRMDAVADDIVGMGFSPDTTKFAVVSANGSVWTWNLTENDRRPHTTNKKIDKELDIPLDQQTYYKGNQSGAWKGYEEMTLQSLIKAIPLITRSYSPKERESFRNLKSQDGSSLFTDKIYKAYQEAIKNPESGRKLLAEALREFGIKETDPGSILAKMYVNSARLKLLQPAFLEAAADYDRAQALDPRLKVADKAAALKKLQEGNEFAKTDIAKAQQSYAAAVQLDSSLTSLAPDLRKTSPELQQESKEIPDVEKLIKTANDLAKRGDANGARDLYEKAKAKAPNALENLNPDVEIERLAPKGPRENYPAAEAAPRFN